MSDTQGVLLGMVAAGVSGGLVGLCVGVIVA